MASVSQRNSYQCDQCGTTNIVAAPVLYEQGTRTYSGTFHSGASQSYSAQSVAPPCTPRILRPLFFWGPMVILFLGLDGFRVQVNCRSPKVTCFGSDHSSVVFVLGLSVLLWHGLINIFAKWPATTARSIPDSVGIGSTPISAGVAGSPASYLPSALVCRTAEFCADRQ